MRIADMGPSTFKCTVVSTSTFEFSKYKYVLQLKSQEYLSKVQVQYIFL